VKNIKVFVLASNTDDAIEYCQRENINAEFLDRIEQILPYSHGVIHITFKFCKNKNWLDILSIAIERRFLFRGFNATWVQNKQGDLWKKI